MGCRRCLNECNILGFDYKKGVLIMLYFFIVGICFVWLLYYFFSELYANDTDGVIIIITLVILIFNGLFLLAATTSGANVYPELLEKRETALSLKSEIGNIKNTIYTKDEIPPNAIVGCSLANMQQANKVLEYVKKYAIAKSSYNSELIKYQTKRKSWILWLVTDVAFISKDIDILKPIE